MPTTPIGLKLPKRGPNMLPYPDDLGEFGRRVERLGYDAVWTNERGSDSFVELTEIALATETLGVGTAVVNVFTRSPVEIGMAAATLATASDGRFTLGIGATHPEKVEGLHGLDDYDRPLRRVHETVDIVRACTSGGIDEFAYDGEIFDAEGTLPYDVEFPVYNAALGEQNRRLTGDRFDGWLPFHVPIPALDRAFDAVADRARIAGRDPESVTVAPIVPAVVSDDPEAARFELRKHVAEYAGRHTDDTYRDAMAMSFPDAAGRAARRYRSGDHAGAADAVTDEMLRGLGVAGAPDEARDRLRELVDEPVVDRPILVVPHTVPGEMKERTVEALAPNRL